MALVNVFANFLFRKNIDFAVIEDMSTPLLEDAHVKQTEKSDQRISIIINVLVNNFIY
jgi:hypothetical protein